MKQTKKTKASATSNIHRIFARLDQSLPLVTEDWQPVEKILSHLSEFAPASMIDELKTAIASFADDQACRGYILGQQDMAKVDASLEFAGLVA